MSHHAGNHRQAIVAGSAIVASGSQPLRQYWERSLARMEQETQNMKNESQGAKDRIKGRAQELKGQATEPASNGTRTCPLSARWFQRAQIELGVNAAVALALALALILVRRSSTSATD